MRRSAAPPGADSFTFVGCNLLALVALRSPVHSQLQRDRGCAYWCRPRGAASEPPRALGNPLRTGLSLSGRGLSPIRVLVPGARCGPRTPSRAVPPFHRDFLGRNRNQSAQLRPGIRAIPLGECAVPRTANVLHEIGPDHEVTPLFVVKMNSARNQATGVMCCRAERVRRKLRNGRGSPETLQVKESLSQFLASPIESGEQRARGDSHSA